MPDYLPMPDFSQMPDYPPTPGYPPAPGQRPAPGHPDQAGYPGYAGYPPHPVVPGQGGFPSQASQASPDGHPAIAHDEYGQAQEYYGLHPGEYRLVHEEYGLTGPEHGSGGAGYRQGGPRHGAGEPGYSEPGYSEPGYSEPGYSEPGYSEPGYGQPGPNHDPGGHECHDSAGPEYRDPGAPEYGVAHDDYGPGHEPAGAPREVPGDAQAPHGPENPSPDATASLRPVHLAARWAMLAYMTVPLFGFVIPLGLYLWARRRSHWTRAHAAQALNVWLTGILYDISVVIMGTMLALVSPQAALLVFAPLIAGLWVITLVFLLRAASAASLGRRYTIPRWLCSTIVR